MKRLLVIATVLFACKQSEPGADWSAKPLDATIESKVSNVAFKLSVPKGWKFDAIPNQKEDDASAISKQWRPDMKDYFSEPSVTVAYEAIPATTLDDFVKEAMLDDKKDVIAKQAQTPDGFVLISHTKNNGIVRAEVMKTKGDAHLACRASQAKTGGVPSPDATMAWLEKLCSSLTIL